MANGVQVGSAAVPPGLPVRVLGVQGDQVEIQCGNTVHTVSAAATDILERIQVLQDNNSRRPTASSSTPIPTPWVPMLKGVH